MNIYLTIMVTVLVLTQVIREGMEMEHETIDAWLKKVEAMA